jgi:peroxiredoxin
MAARSATVGARAPDFSLPITTGPGAERRLASLDDYQNRWLMLLFYPRDFSLV